MTRTERELKSPGVTCQPVGTPGMWTINPYPHQIVMKPGLYVHLIESDNAWNVAHTDGRPHKNQSGWFYSLGREDLTENFCTNPLFLVRGRVRRVFQQLVEQRLL
jgi:hypothetical protein